MTVLPTDGTLLSGGTVMRGEVYKTRSTGLQESVSPCEVGVPKIQTRKETDFVRRI